MKGGGKGACVAGLRVRRFSVIAFEIFLPVWVLAITDHEADRGANKDQGVKFPAVPTNRVMPPAPLLFHPSGYQAAGAAPVGQEPPGGIFG